MPQNVETAYNPGKIIEMEGRAQWLTQAGGLDLRLDIGPVAQTSVGDEIGIASFVVMEQDQPFLVEMGRQLAEALAEAVADKPLLLVTAESKGSHFTPWVWGHLADLCGDQLERRIITLRKGVRKSYMQRPAWLDGRLVEAPQVTYCSITSPQSQQITLSPKDLELLFAVNRAGGQSIFVDDFIGQGGTVVAMHQLFAQLDLTPPRLVAVIGSDGRLYEQTFAAAGLSINLLPTPLPLRLPTFWRGSGSDRWQVTD